MQRVCPKCNLPKPYDPTAPAQRKARGFYNSLCWDCATRKARSSKPKAPQLRDPTTEALEAKLKARLAENRILKAQQKEARRVMKLKADRQFREKNAEFVAHIEQVIARMAKSDND